MTLPTPFATIEEYPRVRRSTAISDQIRSMIINEELKPGDRLPTEEKLCEHFKVSRTTLREAIQMLRVSGLLEVTPGRGSYIQTPDLSQVMSDLALYGVCRKVDDAAVDKVRLSFQRDMMENILTTSVENRKKLYDYVLSRHSDAEENACMEEKWHLELAELGGGEVARLMLQALLTVQHKSRVRRYADMDEVTRTVSVQMRLNNALVDGDVAMAKRVLTSYLGNYATLQKIA